MDGIFYSSLTEGDFDPNAILRQSLLEGDFVGAVAIAETSRDGAARGAYRIANGAGRYELWYGIDAAPDLTAESDVVFTSLPYEGDVLPPAHDYYLVTRYRNPYGLFSENTEHTVVRVDALGAEEETPPLDPVQVSLAASAGGTVKLTGTYPIAYDAEPADTWLIYLTSDGSDPDPVFDTPTEVAMTADQEDRVNMVQLSWTSGTFGEGATIKVILRTRRSGTPDADSVNTTIYSTTATAIGPDSPTAEMFAGGHYQFE